MYTCSNGNALLRLAKSTVFAIFCSGFLVSAYAEDGDFSMQKRIDFLEQQLLELKRQVHIQGQQQHGQNQVVAEELNQQKKDTSALKDSMGKIGGFDVKIGGYVKVDAMYSKYSDGDLAEGSAGRQFYIPSTIPVGGQEENTDLDMQATESRINFSAARNIRGHALKFFTEIDFLLSPGGNERVSNSYSPRLRHYFMKYDNWLLGQTWSTFQDVAALPENLDFVGPAEGSTFARQVQVRYTLGNIELAVENPETTVTPNGGGALITSDDGAIPDMIARYYLRGSWGHMAIAGILRNLSFDDTNPDNDSDTWGGGVSFSGKVKIGGNGDDFRFMLTAGQGLGRYIALNTANGVVQEANGDLETIDSIGGFVSYRHLWNDKWRSNLTYSFFTVDNDTALTGNAVTKDVWSLHANLLYSPVPKVTFGVEYMFAERELEDDRDGNMSRLIMSAKYAF